MDHHEPDGTFHEYDPRPPFPFEWLFAALIAGIWIVIVQVLGGCAGTPDPSAPHLRDRQAQADAAVVVTHICTRPGTELRGLEGSGVLIAPSRVLTAYHVVACASAFDAQVLSVQGRDGIPRRTAIVWRAPVIDLAVLSVVGLSAPPVTYAAPVIGETACSENAIPEFTRSCGKVLAVRDMTAGERIVNVQHSIPTEHGNSGAGVYNAAGALIGVITHANRREVWAGIPPGGLASSVFGRTP